MASRQPTDPSYPEDRDETMASDEDEGEGDVIMGGDPEDSSEEEDDNEEEARRIREGFIVDEDDDEDGEEERRRIKRRKHRHRKRREEEEVLEDDDLDLLEENTGTSFKKNRRIRRGGDRESPEASSYRRPRVESSDSEENDLDLPKVQDIQRIFDEGSGDDTDSFIETDEEEGGLSNEAAREEKQKRKLMKQRQRAALSSHPDLEGFDAVAWDEIHDVFGNGHDYDWALSGEEDDDAHEPNQDIRLPDVFEPSVLKERWMTEDDDLIRQQDVPERMQLSNCSFSSQAALSHLARLDEEDLEDAARWVTERFDVERWSPRRPDQENAPVDTTLISDRQSAVLFALKCMFIMDYEVPYIWTHKRDDITEGLPQSSHLWQVYALGLKYRSFAARRKAMAASYGRLGVQDEYFEREVQPLLDSVEMVADAGAFVQTFHKSKKQDDFEFQFHDDDPVDISKKHKMPNRVSAYEVAQKGYAAKIAQSFGIRPQHVVLNFMSSNIVHFVEDHETNPMDLAEQHSFSGDTRSAPPDELLRQARMIISHELGKDPLLRRDIRNVFQQDGFISVRPTEKGVSKIDEYHPANNFKYLKNKPIAHMLKSSQFLQMLKAEDEQLITISIHLSPDAQDDFERRLSDAFHSDSYSDTAKMWNEERRRIVNEVMEQHLLPAGAKWARDYLRDECEEYIAEQCADQLRSRIDCAPYRTEHMAHGETPSVLAVSWGKGDPQRDAISVVFLDEEGRLRDHTQFDNLVDTDFQDEFKDLLRRRKPDLIVIGGFSMATTKLSQRVKELIRPLLDEHGERFPPDHERNDTPIIYMHDAVARLYRNSDRAAEEFPALGPVQRYCVGLARYAQSPLNEYAALGSDIVAITFDDGDQHSIPVEKLLVSLERALVDVVNKVGVDINRVAGETYPRYLLPFVCGLGPRKAQALIHKINALDGNLINREQFIKASILTTKLFLNASAFLKIAQDLDSKLPKARHVDDDVPDPLDGTRIHPEDYELARKMATDALEIDDEDIHDEHPSYVISLIMQDADREKKLNDLNLEEFADSLLEANSEKKRLTLNQIRFELTKPFAERRPPFPPLSDWDVLTMLSGISPKTLDIGFIVSAQVLRPKGLAVRLDSGIEGVINSDYVSDDGTISLKKGQTVSGVIINVRLNSETDTFAVELSTRATDVKGDDTNFRKVFPDAIYWDQPSHARDQEMLARKRRAQVSSGRRILKHPNFHNFNMSQAEAYLDKQPRGDVVIRPSSKGVNHLAITWKVDDKLYQHINVTDPKADPETNAVGDELIVDPDHVYADLDELIVNHIQAINRRVEELMAHEKFKPGPEDELHMFLKNFVAANPSKSIYGFTVNRRKPGHFNLCFLANKNASVQTWPIRVGPEAYYLFEAAAAGVPELCDAFKVRHLHESRAAANAAAGGKTPYASGRTPARPGHATPGHMSSRTPGNMSTRVPGHVSIRQPPARTPNHYPTSTNTWAPTPAHHGGMTPAPVPHPPFPPTGGFPGAPPYGAPGYGQPNPYQQQAQGYPNQPPYPGYPPQPPPQPPAPAPAPGIHPSRMQMLQGAGGWPS